MTEQISELDELLTFRQLLVKAIEEKGENYIYPRNNHCMYLEYNQVAIEEYEGMEVPIRNNVPTGPSCLLGYALYYLGVPLTTIEKIEGGPITLAQARGLNIAKHEVTIKALRSAQFAQDRQHPWKEALMQYDDVAGIVPGYREAIK